MTYWLAWEEPRAVGDLVHVEKFFARNLGGLIHARTRVPGRLGKATSRTPSMYVGEKSDEAHSTCEATEQGEATPGGSPGGSLAVQGWTGVRHGHRCRLATTRRLHIPFGFH